MPRIPSMALFLAFTLGVAGCGGTSNVSISGTLTKRGVPFQVGEKTQVTLTFAPDVANANRTYPAMFDNATGKFAVELPPGQYKARLVVMDHAKSPAAMLPIHPEFSKAALDLTKATTLTLEIDP